MPTEALARNALQDLNLQDEDLSDEYDFMDDVADGDRVSRRGPEGAQDPKLKYMKILQDVANRDVSEILIELDDLHAVRIALPFLKRFRC